jgi:phage shock protein PspC (stress-responsive transcriptional regulator)
MEEFMDNKRFYRSRTERMIGGVCGGLADFFNIDPTIVRLIFVLLFITGSAGFWIYIILMIVIPEEPILEKPLSTEEIVEVSPSDVTYRQE